MVVNVILLCSFPKIDIPNSNKVVDIVLITTVCYDVYV